MQAEAPASGEEHFREIHPSLRKGTKRLLAQWSAMRVPYAYYPKNARAAQKRQQYAQFVQKREKQQKPQEEQNDDGKGGHDKNQSNQSFLITSGANYGFVRFATHQ